MTGTTRTGAAAPRREAGAAGEALRERVLKAAFAVFGKRGFADASTLEIATRARVSKRDLYALFDSKQAMLAACISARASRMRQPVDVGGRLPESRGEVVATLMHLGTTILRVVCHPDVLAVYRLAIAESDRAPEVARALDSRGREENHRALADWLAKVQARGFIGAGDPAAMAERFLAVLWGGLLIQLLLRVREAPTEAAIEARARAATEQLMALHPPGAAAD